MMHSWSCNFRNTCPSHTKILNIKTIQVNKKNVKYPVLVKSQMSCNRPAHKTQCNGLNWMTIQIRVLVSGWQILQIHFRSKVEIKSRSFILHGLESYPMMINFIMYYRTIRREFKMHFVLHQEISWVFE